MQWWAWLVVAGVSVVIVMMIVVMTLAVSSWRQANRHIRHVERNIGSPLWTYERTTFPRPTRVTHMPPKRPGGSRKTD